MDHQQAPDQLANGLHTWSAVETAAAVRDGTVSAVEVTQAALARIAALNPGLRAFDVVCTEQALADAQALDAGGAGHGGPLAGVPVAVKAEQAVAGLVTTYGGRANTTPAAQDSFVVSRLRAAGAVIVGTTHMPEFGQYPFTEGAAWGATANPWDPTRSPGGSSGGSAVAVAAGMVPVAIGGDGGGSIRIPAACCGLVGLKPVRGRVSAAPADTLWGTLGTIGPLTRTVADTAAVYQVISGNLPTDRYAAAPPREPFTSAAAHEPDRLRIGWLTRSPIPGIGVDSRAAEAVRATAELLAQAGYEVEQLSGRWPDTRVEFLPQFFAAIRQCVASVEHPDRLEQRTRSTAATGAWAQGPVLAAAVRAGHRLARRVERRFAGYDVVLAPVMAIRTPRIGQLDAVGTVRALTRSVPMVAFTTLANVTGHPAISVPAGQDDHGLPIGVQALTTSHDEAVLLSLAAQLERLRPWPLLAPTP